MNDWMILDGPAELVAPRLLGCELTRIFQGQELRVRIVETEAYDQTDAASHSYKGQTPRTAVMFGPSGFLYVYFTYGMHYCMNIVTGGHGHGSAVLIRAAEPLAGAKIMIHNRAGKVGPELTNGPAKLCQALAVDKALNGHNLHDEPLQLSINPAVEASQIMQTTRIGISQAKDQPWRFFLKDNPYVSKL